MPDFTILLFPLEDLKPCALRTAISSERGLAFPAPSLNGSIHQAHAGIFLFGLAHEAAEALLIFPPLGAGCSLYFDPRNRWVGDGIANLVARHAATAAAGEGLLEPMALYTEDITEALQGGRRSIQLAGWLAIGHGKGREKKLEILSYAAAEYLCHRWYEAARARGRERPLADFVRWVRRFSWRGPSHEAVLAWLSSTSGFDIAAMAEDVPLEDVLAYHKSFSSP